MAFWIIPAAIFLGVTALVVAVGMVLRDKQDTKELEDRLDTFAGLTPIESDLPSLLREPIEEVPTQGLLSRIGSPTGSLQKLIVQADLQFGVGPFLLVCSGLAVVGAMAAMLLRLPGPIVPLGATVGLMPLMYLCMRRRGRLKKFGAQLPDALE